MFQPHSFVIGLDIQPGIGHPVPIDVPMHAYHLQLQPLQGLQGEIQKEIAVRLQMYGSVRSQHTVVYRQVIFRCKPFVFLTVTWLWVGEGNPDLLYLAFSMEGIGFECAEKPHSAYC